MKIKEQTNRQTDSVWLIELSTLSQINCAYEAQLRMPNGEMAKLFGKVHEKSKHRAQSAHSHELLIITNVLWLPKAHTYSDPETYLDSDPERVSV